MMASLIWFFVATMLLAAFSTIFMMSLQAMAVEFLRNQGIFVPPSIRRLTDFIQMWNNLVGKKIDEMHNIIGKLRFLSKAELTTAWLENAIERTKVVETKLFFDLDQQRVRKSRKVLDICLDLCKQVTFEEQERLCIQIEGRCQDLLREIEDSPTGLSIEEHRFERAETTLTEAIDELSRKNFRLTVNKAYYSVFYAMRAFLATVDKDYSKHSGVISLFNQHFIKTGTIPKVSFKSIQSLMDLRHEGDYQDFAEITEDEANGAIESAKIIIRMLKERLQKLLASEE